MNPALIVLIVVVAGVLAVVGIIALIAASCNSDINITCEGGDKGSGCSPSSADDTTGNPNEYPADDTVTADDEEPGGVVWTGIELALETSNKLLMRLVVNGPYLSGTVRALEGAGDDLIAPHTLSAEGELLSFPEAKYQIYTLLFQGPPVPDGPCGQDAISYALSLTRHEESPEVIGGIAVHCGDSLDGRPIRMLRLRGELN